MDEITYYQDDNVRITSQQVKLGDSVYPLESVRYARAETKGKGWCIGRVKVPTGLFTWLVFVAVYVAVEGVYYLWSSLSHGDNGGLHVDFYVRLTAIALGVGFQALVLARLQKSEHFTEVLTMVLYPQAPNAFVSTDKKYLESIAKMINHAAGEHYKAQKMATVRTDRGQARN